MIRFTQGDGLIERTCTYQMLQFKQGAARLVGEAPSELEGCQPGTSLSRRYLIGWTRISKTGGRASRKWVSTYDRPHTRQESCATIARAAASGGHTLCTTSKALVPRARNDPTLSPTATMPRRLHWTRSTDSLPLTRWPKSVAPASRLLDSGRY